MKQPVKTTQSTSKTTWIWIACGLTILLGLACWLVFGPGWRSASGTRPAASVPLESRTSTAPAAQYAGSASCQPCHAQAYAAWQPSHHALAERAIDFALDRRAFDPPQAVRHGSQTSQVRAAGNRPEIITRGLDGKPRPYSAAGVIGVAPLRQFLVAAPGGRFQVTELAFDPKRGDWFDVYGQEDRQPGEWGHWSGRGMTWNSMCAGCHNTWLQKNYDERRDAYATTRAERGVGCEACHGPLAAHVAWQQSRTNLPPQARPRDPNVLRLSKDQALSVCGSCHARRGELDGAFRPGAAFLEHFSPIIPDETEVYYPDGQVRDEDFEYVSFLGSRMYSLGVRCQDCHDVHSGKTRASGSDLCLRCHKATIDPLAHGHHALDKPGSQCMDCHMPITVYMARHPRRDHGLTIPDPEFTKDFGVPNACNRCHSDQSVDWAIEAAQKWYGDRMQRHTQQRARWLARARRGDEAAVAPVLTMARQEPIPMWRAISGSLLKRWIHEDRARTTLLASATDPAPLVRAFALRALEPLAERPEVESAFRSGLADTTRLVRIESAWALRTKLDLHTPVGEELLQHLRQNLDQPTGALQMGVFSMDRGQPEEALTYLRRAAAWDTRAPAFRQALAVCLSTLGQKDEAVRQLESACQLAPKDAELQFNLGLALAEVNQLDAAIIAFAKAVQVDPSFARAWYNLGLARSALGQPQRALEALALAEAKDPKSADAPYAQATILQQLGRLPEARQAAHRALERDPNRADAAALLQLLEER